MTGASWTGEACGLEGLSAAQRRPSCGHGASSQGTFPSAHPLGLHLDCCTVIYSRRCPPVLLFRTSCLPYRHPPVSVVALDRVLPQCPAAVDCRAVFFSHPLPQAFRHSFVCRGSHPQATAPALNQSQHAPWPSTSAASPLQTQPWERCWSNSLLFPSLTLSATASSSPHPGCSPPEALATSPRPVSIRRCAPSRLRRQKQSPSRYRRRI